MLTYSVNMEHMKNANVDNFKLLRMLYSYKTQLLTNLNAKGT